MPKQKTVEWFPKRSWILLILMNVLPVFGVIFQDWGVRPILMLYWFEGLLVGLVCALKVVLLPPSDEGDTSSERMVTAFLMALSFVVFWSMHGLGIASLFGVADDDLAKGATFSAFPFGVFAMVKVYTGGLWLVCMGALVFSHLISFLLHFYGRSERRYLGAEKLMFRPYRRIVFYQMIALTAALLATAFDEILPLVLLVIVAKTGIDVIFHITMHREKMRRRVRGGKQSVSFVH